MENQRDEILISIKPEYARQIIVETKTWEYRRKIWRRPVKKVFIYCTLPVGMVVGFFFVGKILRETPEQLWETTKTQGGISKDDFFKYFDGVEYGYAIQIEYVKPYQIFKTLHEFSPGVKAPQAPQSFIYIN